MRSAYCRQHAKDCLRLANDSSQSSTRAMLFALAAAWMRLSHQRSSTHLHRLSRRKKALRTLVVM
jgi:hypothetical protein